VRSTSQDSDGTLTIAGEVNADGTIAFGTSFTVVKSGTGTYVVRWSARAVLGCVVTPITGGAAIATINGHPNGTDGVNVSIFTAAGAAADSAFSFMAQVIPR
jgi:hypothetical protein